MLSWEEIVWTTHQRRTTDAPAIAQMRAMRDRVNADVVIPIRGAPDEPDMPSLAPQVIYEGIEANAMRAGSQMATISVPAMNRHLETGAGSIEYANTRRRAMYASWDFNLMVLLGYRAYRHLAAYGTMAMAVVPCFTEERALIELRNPLNSYPEPRSFDDMRPPNNHASIYGRSREWLDRKYGQEMVNIFDARRAKKSDPSVLWDVLEWIDEDQIVLGVIGPRDYGDTDPSQVDHDASLMLRWWPNRAGMCTVAAPRRITLDRMAGMLDHATGSADWLDYLMALNTMAGEKSIFPDLYAIGDDIREPSIVGGKWEDGRTGKINLLANVKQLGTLAPNASQQSQMLLSLLERNARSGGSPAIFGGENPNSLRTGRALDTMGSFAIDPRIAEMHEIFAAALGRVICPSVMEVEKGYWPTKKYHVFSGWPTDEGYVEYVPEKHFEQTECSVRYPFPGSDVTSISVAVLQLSGGDLMSKRTARQKHPMIDDAHGEEDQITTEKIDATILVSLEQQISNGTLPLIDVANIRKAVAEGKPLHEAMIDADEAARKRQATTPPPPAAPGEEQAEGELGAPPEAMSGLAGPGAGAEMGSGIPQAAMSGGTNPEGLSGINPPRQSQQRLRQMIQAIQSGS